MSFHALSFSLSSACGANCVFCPTHKDPEQHGNFMPLEIVRKVIDEARGYPILLIDVGETGDAFMNPSILDILRYIRSKTTAEVRMFTNFHTFTPAKMDAVLEENLLDKVITNIDGASPETYRAVKGLELGQIERHIDYFIEKKNQVASPVYFRIQSLTLNHYVKTVRRVLGRDPLYVRGEWLDAPDDFESIVRKWAPKGVTPVRSITTLWAEKSSAHRAQLTMMERLKRRLRSKGCRLLARIKNSLFIAPDGRVYLCCADFRFELVYGDVRKQSVKEIVESEGRRDLLALLSERKFSQIGGPCSYAHLCQLY